MLLRRLCRSLLPRLRGLRNDAEGAAAAALPSSSCLTLRASSTEMGSEAPLLAKRLTLPEDALAKPLRPAVRLPNRSSLCSTAPVLPSTDGEAGADVVEAAGEGRTAGAAAPALWKRLEAMARMLLVETGRAGAGAGAAGCCGVGCDGLGEEVGGRGVTSCVVVPHAASVASTTSSLTASTTGANRVGLALVARAGDTRLRTCGAPKLSSL